MKSSFFIFFIIFFSINFSNANTLLEDFESAKNKYLDLYYAKNYPEALEASNEYIKLAEEVYPELDNQKATAYYNVSALLIDMSLYDEAKDNLIKSFNIET